MFRSSLIISALLLVLAVGQAQAAGTTYYVSSSGGDDTNDGLSTGSPLATVDAVNSLNLQPGDRVLFKCGDLWRADPLIITASGTADNPITFGSYPAGCADQPTLSGSWPVSGWSLYSGSIYVADLDPGRFPYGLNQLFRDGERLRLGRWPNLEAGDGGYAAIDNQPAADRITDNQLSPGDWSGAIAHIRGMRWYILNRAVTGQSDQTLTLGADAGCWGNDCTGWGYFLNNHLNTLDQDGEWFYNADSGRLYLYSDSGSPANIEGAVVMRDDDRAWGGVVLGNDLKEEIAYVVVENLAVRNWYLHGITTPTNLKDFENSYLTLRNNTIADVDGDGIHLATWVWDADDGENGWRGGHHLTVSDNLVDGANHKGIDSYAKQSTFSGNTIRNIGLIENLNASGMGCSLTAGGGSCTEDGDGLRIKIGNPADSGHSNLIQYNRLEKIAYNGMDIFGPNNTIEYNLIESACYAKGDCGGVRTFGRDNLSQTPVHDLTFRQNIIVDTLGNTDGCIDTYDPLFGFGLYIDNYSRDVTMTGNTVISSTVAGIHYQRSTGSISGNTLYNNSRGSMYSAQVGLDEPETIITDHSQNVLYSLKKEARTLTLSAGATLAAGDYNYFFNPYEPKHIAADGAKTLAEWQAYSGLDTHSTAQWFSLEAGDSPRSRIFYNATATTTVIDLGATLYRDLDQGWVSGSLSLPPFSSQVLVVEGTGADLVLSMAAVSGADTAPGLPLTYTLTITNQGEITADQVVLTHTVPPEVVNTGWQASLAAASRSGSGYVWDLPDLGPDTGGVITITGQYTDSLAPDTPLALFAEIKTDVVESSTANNQALLLLGDWSTLYLPILLK